MIEKNIPMPTRKGDEYPFAQMQPGGTDSFFVPTPEAEGVTQNKLRDRVSNSCSAFCKRNKGFKFAVRLWPNGVRVWRIDPVEPERKKPGRKPMNRLETS
jgi:hypothetical protein